MSLLLALLAPLTLAQVGPFTPSGGSASPLPPELQDRRRPRREVPVQPALPPAASAEDQGCISSIAADPAAAADRAEQWRARAARTDRGLAALCLGMARSEQQQWAAAEAAFLDGREASASAPALRARLGAMAGNAALAQGAAERALGLLDTAKVDLGDTRTGALPVDIELDRARAFVALQRLPEAEAALADARTLAPENAEAWLLSATLARRQGKLGEAQARIEKAAQLLPVDPEIGLEAGVIAMLAGREDAARKSWQSVLAAAPQSAAAETAKGYLGQLGSPTKP